MPTVITHCAVPLAMSLGLGARRIPPRLLAAGMLLCMLPDLDVLAFRYGIAYADPFGHRGFTHSLSFALVSVLAVAGFARPMGSTYTRAFVFLFIAMGSHGLLDSFTNGGLGIALLWPFSEARFFAPWRPIAVSPIGVRHVLTDYGMAVMWSELRWVWLPLSGLALAGAALRRLRRRAPQHNPCA
jgi:inner membrane protein